MLPSGPKRNTAAILSALSGLAAIASGETEAPPAPRALTLASLFPLLGSRSFMGNRARNRRRLEKRIAARKALAKRIRSAAIAGRHLLVRRAGQTDLITPERARSFLSSLRY